MTVWDRQAENCCQYLRKGSGVHVEGYLKMDTWDDKTTGEKRSKIPGASADRVQFLDSRRGDSGPGGGPDDDYGSGSFAVLADPVKLSLSFPPGSIGWRGRLRRASRRPTTNSSGPARLEPCLQFRLRS